MLLRYSIGNTPLCRRRPDWLRICLTLAFGLALSASAQLQAQTFSREGVDIFPGSGHANDVKLADFNADGKLDLAVIYVAGDWTGTLTLYLGDGHGRFTTGNSYITGMNPWSIATGDFNGDGKLDIAVCNDGAVDNLPDSIAIWLGDGRGNYTPAPGSPMALPANTGPLSLAVADFNRDGKPDLVSANLHNNTVSAYLGSGNGSFTLAPGSPVSMPIQPWHVVVADFNGDGKQDVAVGAYNNAIGILLGDGNGGLAHAPGSPFAVTWMPLRLAVGDFDRDGKADLAVAHLAVEFNWPTYGAVAVLFGNGNGTFRPDSHGLYVMTDDTTDVVVADFNLDGKQDIAAVAFDGFLTLLAGNGSGGFTQQTPNNKFAINHTAAVGDIDGDGSPDVVISSGTMFLNETKPPSLRVTKSHAGNFRQAQSGEYSIVVSAENGSGPTRGSVNLQESIPTGLALTSISGAGWNCAGTACSRADLLTSGASYPPITVTVVANVGAPSQVSNVVTAATPGGATVTASDLTTILKFPQSISFGPLPARTYGNAPFPVAAVASSGLPVVFSSTTPAVCGVSGTTVSISGGGTCSIVAGQPGNEIYEAAPPVAQSFVVNRVRTTTTMNLDGNSLVTVVSPVSAVPALPGGIMQFSTDGSVVRSVAFAGGRASIPAPVGLNVAVYLGDANFEGSTSNSVTVYPPPTTSLTVLGSPNSSVLGQAVTFTASLSTAGGAPTLAAPTGTVRFLDAGKSLGSALLAGGAASLTTSALSGGAHTITAEYAGDWIWPAASATVAHKVSAIVNMTFSTAPAAPVYGQPVALTVSLADTIVPAGFAPPAGQVSFQTPAPNPFSQPAQLGIATLSSGTAVLTLNNLAVGAQTIVATYSGDAVWNGQTRNFNLVVSPAPTSSTVSLTLVSGELLLSGTIAAAPAAGKPTGVVRFLDTGNGAVIASAPLSNGAASAQLAAGSAASVVGRPIAAVYSGDANFKPSTSAALPVVVNAASMSVTTIAPDAIASAFGVSGLTASGGVSLKITDSAGRERSAELYGVFDSVGQINFVAPQGMEPGLAPVAIASPGGAVIRTVVHVAATAPGIFTADMGGEGPFVGQQIYVHADGVQSTADACVADSGKSGIASNPIRLNTPGDQVYLVLYGTGLRHAGALTAKLNGLPVPVVYFGAQGAYAGLDQINVGPLPPALAGAGPSTLVIAADGRAANPVRLTIQ